MARFKIDYGIDLGTTNSAITRMENGESVIKKTDTLKDTLPSCVSFTKKKSIKVGDTAYNDMKSEKRKATHSWKKSDSNTFLEFKRTMGTDKKYISSIMNESFTSEQLSAEVLKTLKSFVTDEDIKSIVITVPAKFTINQKDATARAAKLAGFEHCELLQEPVAASMAYGLSTSKKDGFWLVFDFGGGTYDAALLKVEDGIMKVIDTEGDNYLGGKNIDYAIVDEIIIPYLKQNFAISNILANEEKRDVLREAMKTYAEEVKIQLSFKESEDIISNLGDLGEDDDETEIELDLRVTQTDLANAIGPLYQKAIDISKELLKRKNLKGSQLDSLILVGGPTYSPILRRMLKDQITDKIDTSCDPMTVVAKGAALYASTIEVSEKIIEENRDKSKIQLEIKAEPTTVEAIEWVTIKFLRNKTTGNIPSKIYAEVVRADKAWSSGKIEINEKGDIFEVHLNEGKANSFAVNVYDDKGSLLQSEPSEFTIIQGSKIGSATLPYHIGIEIKDRLTEKMIFLPVKGLEKNAVTPAIGVINGIKTSSQIRPGIRKDYLKIPIYQGENNANGSLAILNEHVYDLIITGDDLPKLLPAGSTIDLTIEVGKSEQMTCKAYFPVLDETVEIKFDEGTTQKIPTPTNLEQMLKNAQRLIEKLKRSSSIKDKTDLTAAEEHINEQSRLFEQAQNDDDRRQQINQEIKRIMQPVDKLEINTAWDRLENEIRTDYERLEKANKEKGDESTTKLVTELYRKIDEVIRKKDDTLARHILDEIQSVYQYVTRLEQLIVRIFRWDENFENIKWTDKARARQLVNQGIPIVNEHIAGLKQYEETVDLLHPIVIAAQDLLPNEICPKCGLEIGVPGGCPHVTN